MRKIKIKINIKLILNIINIVLIIIFCSVAVYAEDNKISQDARELLEEAVQEQLDVLMQEELQDVVPEDAEKLLESLDWDELDIGKLIALTPRDFFKVVVDYFKELVQAPWEILGRLMGVMLLCGLMSGLKTSVFSDELEGIFSLVSVLCTVSFLAQPIIDCIVKTTEALRQCSLFILSFIPVFSGVITAGGNPAAGGVYNLFLFTACQLVSNIASETLVPMMGIYFALCIVAAVVPDLKLSGIVGGIKSIVCWSLGIITTAFVGLLSLQTIVSTGADTVTLKTSKFLLGSMIPVIGSVLSDALSAAQGCLRLLKGVVGSFGMLVAAGTFLPVLVQVVIWYVAVGVAGEIGKMLGVKEVTEVLKSAGETLAILIAVIICFALLIIISTTLVLIMCTGI